MEISVRKLDQKTTYEVRIVTGCDAANEGTVLGTLTTKGRGPVSGSFAFSPETTGAPKQFRLVPIDPVTGIPTGGTEFWTCDLNEPQGGPGACAAP